MSQVDARDCRKKLGDKVDRPRLRGEELDEKQTFEATDILPPEFFAFQQGVALRDDNQTNEMRGGLWKKKDTA